MTSERYKQFADLYYDTEERFCKTGSWLPRCYTAGPMKVSLVIPAYNEAHYLGQCLDALLLQRLSRSDFEVFVVDNGSTDGTPELARRHAASRSLNIQVVSHGHGSISAVRNFGASQTSGEILAFLDADCLPDSDWLLKATELAPSAGLWGAHYLIPEDATWVGRTWFTYQAKSHQGDVSFLPGGNVFVRRRDFEAVGGFDERVKTSEDVDLSSRIRRAGMPVVAIPELAVIHLGTPRTLRRFYRQNRWHGQEVLRLFLKNLPSTKNLPLVFLSLFTLTCFWVTIFSSIYALFVGFWYIPLAAFLLLIAPSFLIAFQRSSGSNLFRSLGPLFVLYLVYFLARAAAARHLFSFASAGRRGRIKT